MIVFITGGVKSGKSWFGLNLALNRFKSTHFVATGVPFDQEMKDRIAKHREDRGDSMITVEEPVNIDRIDSNNFILDDLTVWMSNLFYEQKEERWPDIFGRFLTRAVSGDNSIIVSNETGLGNIPMDPMTRKYNRYLGEANRQAAAAAGEVYFMVSGIPVKIKSSGGGAL